VKAKKERMKLLRSSFVYEIDLFYKSYSDEAFAPFLATSNLKVKSPPFEVKGTEANVTSLNGRSEKRFEIIAHSLGYGLSCERKKYSNFGFADLASRTHEKGFLCDTGLPRRAR